MGVTNLTRNLRDSELIISDGTSVTPKTLTLIQDEGDLNWGESDNTVEVPDRGSVSASAAHTRPGNDETCSLSFTAKLMQLLGKTVSSSNVSQLYEMINNLTSYYTSTSSTGQQYTLKYDFTITDPAGANSEKVTFAKVYKTSLNIAESDNWDTISFSGKDFERRPVITRV